ncbi:hypothetical protein ILP97_07510 [Amycolatopsis sp. H6(2020)]|nr:hypothetical protein [Amycolatopsis sp. H6(2020)]
MGAASVIFGFKYLITVFKWPKPTTLLGRYLAAEVLVRMADSKTWAA